MQMSLKLLSKRRFLPLFSTQFLGAFNDSLFKQVVILFVTYRIYNDPKLETQFNAIATGLFILPFFLLSALSGQLADMRDKAPIIRTVKLAEIGIMLVGALAFWLAMSGAAFAVPLMLTGVLAMGIHSTFFGPIKYAILPQHLKPDEVLGGTGLVEAGTYLAILAGTIVAGFLVADLRYAAFAVVATAILGWLTGRQIPPAPSTAKSEVLDFNVLRSSIRLVSATMHIPRLFLAIISISFFWTIGSVLIIQFPPLVKNVLTSNEQVASLFLAAFSIGIAIGSVAINRLLKGQVSARYAPASVVAMGIFVVILHIVVGYWQGAPAGKLYTMSEFVMHDQAWSIIATLLGISISGGMFVVPLYAFLTTTVDPSQTARTVAANNIVNAGAMVVGSLLAIGLSLAGLSVVNQLLMTASMCLVSAFLAYKLHKACL
jgi:MFS family permease